MITFKAVLVDVDGVLVLPPKMFSEVYTDKYGVDPAPIQDFFKHDFLQALIGKADLKELITKRSDVWHWEGDPQQLLDMWFSVENHPNQELVDLIRHYRKQGFLVYLATNQEKYRNAYLETVTFPNMFDGIFTACRIGYLKNQPEFWASVLKTLASEIPGIRPEQIIYFDDSHDHIEAAAQAGITACLYESNKQVKGLLQSGVNLL